MFVFSFKINSNINDVEKYRDGIFKVTSDIWRELTENEYYLASNY